MGYLLNLIIEINKNFHNILINWDSPVCMNSKEPILWES